MATSNRDLIMEALRISSQSLDDDELARRTGITPRQSVNQTCRRLEAAGLLRRIPGPEGKLVNVLSREELRPVRSSRTDQPLATPAVRSAENELPAGSSAEQRAAERIMLDLLGARLGVQLDPGRITVPSGARVEVDGTDVDRTILVECWAHQGKPKAAQRHKVLSDALKLTWIASTIYPRPRLVLCLSDQAAAAPFRGTSRTWAGQAFADLGITVEVVELPADVRAAIVAAQQRQYR